MSDLLHQNFSTVQSSQQPTPVRMAGAAVLAPTTKLTFVDAQVALVTITPPVTGYHELTLVFTNAAPAAFSVAGNLLTAYQPIQNRPVDLCYDPVSAKYLVKAVV